MAYHPASIEPKWQKFWETHHLFKAETGSKKPKYYILDMFPYPSSSGLHVGHPEGYTATDIIARYKRAKGFNVLHPMGWDAFGLPAEQYAIQTGVHPAITTEKSMDTFRRQLKSLGLSYDWSRELATCDPKFYKWTQFIFLKLYEKGLAYQKEVPVNWCPALKTVLANEEVVDGRSERGGHPVLRVPMKQWMLKITSYAEGLLSGLDQLDWPEGTKELQRNWIGRSAGLQLQFNLKDSQAFLEIFTTRPDTLFGVTYIALAPEHPLVDQLATPDKKQEIEAYRHSTAGKSEVSRQDTNQKKTGVFTGSYAINPVSGEEIPIWIADYVFINYGSGAVMGVPGHDTRDFQFAMTFDLPMRRVVDYESPQESSERTPEQCFTGQGVAVNSGFISGLKSSHASEAIIQWAEQKGCGKKTVQYKLRDWLFSRQRYWGEPFPMVYLEGDTMSPLPLDLLPVVLPNVESYEPSGTGKSPLAGIVDWVNTQDPKTGKPACRETDTMPGSAGSSWYFLRFCDPNNQEAPFHPDAEKYWMPVDFYMGGPEHAVGHLLYARFWTHVLYDAGLVSCREPFQKLYHQGMILGEDGEKMSKSRGNVINPDHIIEQYGADTLRVYEMFMGPLERDKPWSTSAIEGVYRFLQRTWRLFVDDEGQTARVSTTAVGSQETLKQLHKTIQKVTDDIENCHFNTAVSQMMIFVNYMTQLAERPISCLLPFVQLLQPFAPHLAEELWERLGQTSLLTLESWPSFDPNLARDHVLTIAVQIMGKTRATLEVPVDVEQEVVVRLANQNLTIANHLKGKEIKKVIFVKNKILNFVHA